MANAPCDVVHSAMQGKAGDVVCWCHPPRVSLQNSRFKEKRMLIEAGTLFVVAFNRTATA